jgi:hypothetical protein
LQGITQIINKDAGKVENLAEFVIAGTWKGYLNVEGSVTPSRDKPSRVDVVFNAFSVGIEPLPALRLPLTLISPKVRFGSLTRIKPLTMASILDYWPRSEALLFGFVFVHNAA